MRQYPIWNGIDATGGKASPSHFGARDGFRQHVYVGTGSRNSHEFAKIEVERRHIPGGKCVEFVLYVDGVMIKRGVLDGAQFEIDIDAQRESMAEHLDVTLPRAN